MSRKILAALLAAVTAFSTLAMAACNGSENGTKTPEQTTVSETAVQTQTPKKTTLGETENPRYTGTIFNPFEGLDEDDEPAPEHKKLEALPSSATLVGSDFLPPIDNQGGVGSCASEAITYMQFSNAVARYLANKDENSQFLPAKSQKYCFSPKFTYLYSFAGTACVYDILIDHGCSMADPNTFYKSGGASQIKSGSNTYEKSLKWEVAAGEALDSLKYRATDYEQIWLTKAPYNEQLTTTDVGNELLTKIKEAVASGNVVVTGGYPSRWQTTIVTKKGELGKVGDEIVGYSLAVGDGGHQVAIVGYDDNICCNVKGTELRGAFLIANSWGTSWGNKGFIWMAYDACNTKSEFEELNPKKPEDGKELEDDQTRGWSLDQFCFLYWDSDVTDEMPKLMTEVEIEATDREMFYITLSREDSMGNVETYMPHLFSYGAGGSKLHDNYGKTNFKGQVGTGTSDTGYFTLSFDGLTKYIPKDASVNEYIWGVKVTSLLTEKSEDTVIVRSVKLLDSTGKVIKEEHPSGEISDLSKGGNVNYVFRLSEELKTYRINGDYKLSTDGKYMYTKVTTNKFDESSDKAQTYEIIYDSTTHAYNIKSKEGNYVFDVSGKKVIEGADVKLNAVSAKRTTQHWKLLDNEDGTFCIYLAQAGDDGRYYAIGVKDGKTVLVPAEDAKNSGRWKFELGNDSLVRTELSVSGGEYTFTVSTTSSKPIGSVKILDSDGKEVKSGSDAGEYKLGKLSDGNYSAVVVHPNQTTVYYFSV